MARFSKTLGEDDMRQLTIAERFDTEPFPSAKTAGEMKVKDEQGSLWKFKYKVSRSKRVISGNHWQYFLQSNGVEVGHSVAIHRDDADYKIEVIKTGI